LDWFGVGRGDSRLVSGFPSEQGRGLEVCSER
jgi:hypothetical protein